MTPEQDKRITEIHTMATEALKSARRTELYFFDDPQNPSKKPSRAERLDHLILGLQVGGIGYRIIMGLTALIIAIGGAWTVWQGVGK